MNGKELIKEARNFKTEYGEDLVAEIKKDFESRRNARRNIESKWLLNINFMLGNQYSTVAPTGDIVDYGKQYYWQEREVYNHIAPIIETRLAKFARVNCKVNVRPASSDDKDIETAKLSAKLIEATQNDNGFVKLFGNANYWAELTGTVFYKVLWSATSGKVIGALDGRAVREGEARIIVCPSYEVYPDSLGAADVSACRSIIHAKAYPVQTIEDIWGVKVGGGDVSVINMDVSDGAGGFGYTSKNLKVYSDVKNGHAIVIERYEAPSKERPEGRLAIVAGDKLLYEGALPYINGKDGARTFPFIRQTAFESPGSFYGVSVIERLIPVQRAYNAVKNRKHEFINRLSVGVLAVEDGSVDIEGLEDEGLSPGKIITYRQGSTPPQLMSPGSVPSEFRDEEDRLLAEFQSVSGVSNMLNVSTAALTSVSGYALSLLLEQDYSRLSVTTESIRAAVKEICKHILRLYRQFAKHSRLLKISGENGSVEVDSFIGSELNSDDIVMESDSEMTETPATRKNMVLELMNYGLLGDENGKISNRNRSKIMEMLGFGNWESSRSDDDAHLKKAALENSDMEKGEKCAVAEADDHDLHIGEHNHYIVVGRETLSDKAVAILEEHIRRHKILKRLSAVAEGVSVVNTEKE